MAGTSKQGEGMSAEGSKEQGELFYVMTVVVTRLYTCVKTHRTILKTGKFYCM